MPSLNLDLNYFDHLKTMRLVARLGNGSDVLPIRLWAYVGRHRPSDGIIEGLSPKEIEHICGWWGEPLKMLQALLDFGYLNAYRNRDHEPCNSDSIFTADPPQIYEINDWLEHSGHLSVFKKRAVKAAKKRWGIKSKRSNASSIAKGDIKQCPSSAVQDVAVQSIAINNRAAAPPAPAPEPPYKRPDAKTEPLRTLVFGYKLKKGFPAEDRTWDRQVWPRASKAGKLILEAFDGNLRSALTCLESLADEYEKKGLDWTLETIEKHCLEWKLKHGGYSHGSASSERVFDDFIKRGPKGKSERSGGLVAAGQVIAGMGVVPDIPPGNRGEKRLPVGGNDGALAGVESPELEAKPDRGAEAR